MLRLIALTFLCATALLENGHAQYPRLIKLTNTESSSFYLDPFKSEKAIDFRVAPNQDFCFFSHIENEPYWRAAVETPQPLHTIRIVNRGDCCPERMQNVQASVTYVGDEGRYTKCGDDFKGPGKAYEVIDFTCPSGRNVAGIEIRMFHRNFLQLCEVFAYTHKPNEPINYATYVEDLNSGRIGSQIKLTNTASSSFWNYDIFKSHKAIDELVAPKQEYCFFSHLENEPHWNASLLWPQPVHTIRIINRGDCCPERMKNVQASVMYAGEDGRYTKCGNEFKGPGKAYEVIDFNCPSSKVVTAIEIRMFHRNFLQLCEVQAFVGKAPEPVDYTGSSGSYVTELFSSTVTYLIE